MPKPEHRKILHVDMDAFFASVEQLDHPEYRGKPVVVGADPQGGRGRGVVAACSYEARRYGIHSAMPIGTAWKRCPSGVFVRPRGDRYAQVSRAVFSVLERFSDLVEPLSIDEAFLDVTGVERLLGPAEDIAADIKNVIRQELGLAASVGIGPNKFIAKIASDLEKPDGLVVVAKERVREFLDPLPISRLWGVGPKTAEVLQRRGLQTVGDVARYPRPSLQTLLGESGDHLWRLANGIDERPVIPESEPQSVGAEVTFHRDQTDSRVIRTTLLSLAEKVAKRLRRQGVWAGGVTLKYRDSEFTTYTRSLQLNNQTQWAEDLFAAIQVLLVRIPIRNRPVRLLGITATHLYRDDLTACRQLGLFGDQVTEEKEQLARTTDAICDRFGSGSLVRAVFIEEKSKSGKDDN